MTAGTSAVRGRWYRLRHAPMIDSALAVLFSPLWPAADRLHLHRRTSRSYRTDDVLVPDGYAVEVVASGLNSPVHCCFDHEGMAYVVESGHKIQARPRVVKVDPATGTTETFFELPEDRWKLTGAVTGGCWADGVFFLMNTDTLSRLTPDGHLEDVVTDLPGLGDHQANYPVLGPDGKLYFGQGTATNSGVVGSDNFAYEWLRYYPTFHDYPGSDVKLVGRNYEFPDVLGSSTDTVRTGAFVPFGTETSAGQIIQGRVKCNGSVLRCRPDGTDVELVAWGFRNPYGIAFAPDGRLFVTEHGSDERNARQIIGDLEDFYEVTEGRWYGWPDYASGTRLDDPFWGDGGRGREPVIAEPPDEHPPKPFANFPQHSAPNGFDFSPVDGRFAFPGQAFVALFGDLTPVTARLTTPAGFKVVRIDLDTGEVADFAVNRIQGPASRLHHRGFERPSHCCFGPDGALYVVDFGEVRIAPEAGGIRVVEGSGTLWRIRRTDGPAGSGPAKPVVIPSYAAKTVAGAAAVVGLAATFALRTIRRRRNRTNRRRRVWQRGQ